MTIDCMRPGELAIIESVVAEGRIRSRLLDMGFVAGTPVAMVRRAPMGGPFEVELRGSLLSLRLEEARTIFVKDVKRRFQGRGCPHAGKKRRGPFGRWFF